MMHLQGYKPKDAKNDWQPSEVQEEIRNSTPQESPEGTNPADTLILHFWSLEQRANTFLPF